MSIRLNADSWVLVLKSLPPADVRACGLVCADLRAAAHDDELWRSHCRAREVASGIDEAAVDGWLDELRRAARMPSFAALHALLERTGMAGGVGSWSSVSRQPNGALLTTSWEDGQLIGTLTSRASFDEDAMLGLRSDRAFALSAIVERYPHCVSPAVRVRLQLRCGEQYLGALSDAAAEVSFVHRPARRAGGTGRAGAGADADGAAFPFLVGDEQWTATLGAGASDLVATFAPAQSAAGADYAPWSLRGLHAGLERAFRGHSAYRGRKAERFIRLAGTGLVPCARAPARAPALAPSLGLREGGAQRGLSGGAGELTGLYVSRYGSHGLELLEVVHLAAGEPDPHPIDPLGCGGSAVRRAPRLPAERTYRSEVESQLPERLAFRKVLGDQNVPANFLTFYVPLEAASGAEPGEPTTGSDPANANQHLNQMGPIPIEPQHLEQLRASGIAPEMLAGVLRGEMQLNRLAQRWQPEWEPLLLFPLKPEAPGGPMRTFATLWCSTSLVLTFRRFEPELHVWRESDPPATRRAISRRVAEDIGGGFTFVGDWAAVADE